MVFLNEQTPGSKVVNLIATTTCQNSFSKTIGLEAETLAEKI